MLWAPALKVTFFPFQEYMKGTIKRIIYTYPILKYLLFHEDWIWQNRKKTKTKNQTTKFAPLQLVFSWLLQMIPINTPLKHLHFLRRAPWVCSYWGQLSLLGTAASLAIFRYLFLCLDWQDFIMLSKNLEIKSKLVTLGYQAPDGPFDWGSLEACEDHGYFSAWGSAGDPPAPMVFPTWAQV